MIRAVFKLSNNVWERLDVTFDILEENAGKLYYRRDSQEEELYFLVDISAKVKKAHVADKS